MPEPSPSVAYPAIDLRCLNLTAPPVLCAPDSSLNPCWPVLVSSACSLLAARSRFVSLDLARLRS